MKLLQILKNAYSEWRENIRTRIVDTSHLKKVPERSALHWFYIVLFAVSMVAVLWQHCHPFITILILALILPLSAQAHISYARFGFGGRFLVQLIIVIFALIWTFYRIKTGVTVDKTAVELIGIATTTFLMGRRNRDYGYIFLICMFLLIYASLLPRILFLFLFFAAVILILVILYYNRPINLAGDPDLKTPELKRWRSFPNIILHLALAILFFFLIFSLLPTRPTKTKGAMEVSFLTDKDSFMPPDMQTWLRGDNIKSDPKAKIVIRKSEKPDSLGNTGKPVNIKNSKTAAKVDGNGSGSSSQGEDMIFTVKSPLKLYHLVQLYDLYDGFTWKLSKELGTGSLRNISRQEQTPDFFDVEIQYNVVKWISPKLFAPYRPTLFSIGENQENIRIFQRTFFNAELYGRHYPRTPFRYKVSTRITLPLENSRNLKKKEKVVYWLERISKKHYQQLPPKKISKRLKELVLEQTRDLKDPYEKAIKLRDYLRNNLSYKLHAEKPPENKEIADYFIFDLKEGHCEYFATSLAVLARIAGLPTRIATGFSPGNYNTLNNQFEVYEYHAHAWTQIFIENKGWLTFDATPPQSIPSKTTPLGIGMLRDPFGDEWKISPPEITSATVDFVQNAIIESEKEKTEEISKMDEMIAKALTNDPNKEKKTVKKAEKKEPPKKKNWITQTNDILRNFNSILGSAMNAGLNFLTASWKWLLPVVILGLTFGIAMKMIFILFRQQSLMSRASRYMEIATKNEKDSTERILCMYFAVRLLLIRANLPRKKNQELMAYAKSLKSVSDELALEAAFLFSAFYSIEYGNRKPDVFETENVLNRTENIRSILLKIIRGEK